jgi:hypothetical protein
MRPQSDYDKFDALATGLLKVPHDAIKSKVDAEKKTKKRKKARKPSAARERA